MSESVERTSFDLRYQAYRLRNDAAEARFTLTPDAVIADLTARLAVAPDPGLEFRLSSRRTKRASVQAPSRKTGAVRAVETSASSRSAVSCSGSVASRARPMAAAISAIE